MPLKYGYFYIQTSVEDMTLVVAVKYDFAFHEKSEVKAYCGIFGLSRLWYEENINSLIRQKTSTSFKFSAQTTIQDNKLLITEN